MNSARLLKVLRIYALLSACIFASSNIVPEVKGFDEEWPSFSHIDAVPSEMTRDAIIMERAQGGKTCFNDFGCFQVGNSFTHPLGLPSSPDYIGASTWFYSRGRYRTNPKEIDFRRVSSLDDMSELETNKPLFILIHGFLSSRKHIWIIETVIALLAKADCNVITVDWAKSHSLFRPGKAAYDTALVGKLLALLVNSIMNRHPKAISASSIHVIGQSFGAHVASFFAKHFKKDPGRLVGRITGDFLFALITRCEARHH
uniref:Putative phospholipase n=1 Tax=Ixodes ricinus TaxID=34613 RepID=A0A0K8R927_IXORI